MSILRIYNPEEVGEDRRPLDWERCRTCNVDSDGTPIYHDGEGGEGCPTCGGHGSLKAAALRVCLTMDEKLDLDVIRCEDCRHPLGAESWDGEWSTRISDGGKLGPRMPGRMGGYLGFEGEASDEQWADAHEQAAYAWLRRGQEPHETVTGHYTACDDRCEHTGPGRSRGGLLHAELGLEGWQTYEAMQGVAMMVATEQVEALWRPVAVRTLGWPFDLHAEQLAILCLRCYATRRPTR